MITWNAHPALRVPLVTVEAARRRLGSHPRLLQGCHLERTDPGHFGQHRHHGHVSHSVGTCAPSVCKGWATPCLCPTTDSDTLPPPPPPPPPSSFPECCYAICMVSTSVPVDQGSPPTPYASFHCWWLACYTQCSHRTTGPSSIGSHCHLLSDNTSGLWCQCCSHWRHCVSLRLGSPSAQPSKWGGG